MNETILRHRRALRRAVVRSVVVVATCAFALPLAVAAQAAANTAAHTTKEFPSFIFAPQAHYGAPLGGAVGAALLVPAKPWRCDDGFCGAPGIEVQAMTGIGGWRVAGGITTIAFPLWADALVTITRTRSAPRRASPESTYLGGEGGISFPVYVKGRSYAGIRSSIGIAQRIDGAGASADRTNFTWNVGAVLMLPKF